MTRRLGGLYRPKKHRTKFRPNTEPESEPESPTNLNDVKNNDDTSSMASSAEPVSLEMQQPPNTQTPSTYVNIAPLPIFHGTSEECPIVHISRFTKVCRANNASSTDMMMKIFPVTLVDEAALWYDLNVEPYYASLAWEETKVSFMQAYEKPEDLETQLMSLTQGENEMVRSYFLRMQLILRKCATDGGISDGVLKRVFVDGLRGDIKECMDMQKVETLSEALRVAFLCERVMRGKSEAGNVKKCGFCGVGGHEERECEVRERMRELWFQSKEKRLVRMESLGKSLCHCSSKKKLELNSSNVSVSGGNSNACWI